MRLSTKSKLGSLGLVVLLSISACDDYLNNRDRVSPHTGDAMDANTAIQTIDPWPPTSYDTRIPVGN